MTTSDLVLLETSGPLARITLNRPDRGNALDLATALALEEALAASAGAHVRVLAGRGRMFCAGGDVAGFAAATDRTAHLAELVEVVHRCVLAITGGDPVLVAAVHGPAAGAGFSLAAAADVVVASRAATFTSAYGRVGLSPDGGSTAALPPTLGLHRSLAAVLLDDPLTAEQAHAAGLVARLAEPETFDTEVDAVVERLLAGSAPAHATAKHLLRRQVDAGLPEVLDVEGRTIAAIAATPDGVEGVDAFVAKRVPSFGR